MHRHSPQSTLGVSHNFSANQRLSESKCIGIFVENATPHENLHRNSQSLTISQGDCKGV